MTTVYRDFILKWSPNGSASSIAITNVENNQIGAFKKMRVKSITTPLTFYAISNINNTLLLEEDNSGTWNTVTLTPGNYTGAEFATEVKTQFETIGAGTYTVTISDTTNKITISVSGGASTFSAAFKENDNQREKIWGVPHGTAGQNAAENPPTNAQINDAPSGSYTSANPIMIWGPDYMLLKSETLVKMLNKRHTVVIDTALTGTSGVDASGNAVTLQ